MSESTKKKEVASRPQPPPTVPRPAEHRISPGASRQAVHRQTVGVARTGLLFALALILQWLEMLLPPLPLPVPAKPGLSNIVVMYALCYISRRYALAVALLKGLFAFLMRGLMAGLLSLTGGLLALVVMLVADYLTRAKISWLLLSVLGSLAHNAGQLLCLTLLMPVGTVQSMLPFLLLIGLLTGALSAALLKLALKALRQVPTWQMEE